MSFRGDFNSQFNDDFDFKQSKLIHPQSELIREPRLLEPGEKPIGNVVVNTVHPLAKNLEFCCIFGTRNSSLYPVYTYGEKGAGASGRLYGGTVIDPRLGLVGNGVNLYGLELLQHKIHSGSLSLFAKVKVNNTSHIGQFITGDNLYPFSRDWQLRLSDGKVHFIIFEGGVAKTELIGNTLIPTDRFINVAGVHPGRAGAIAKVYLDGHVDDTYTTTAALDSNSPSVNIGIFSSTKPTTNNSQLTSPLNGYIECAYGWSRALSDSEIRSISADPYQFLIPA